MLVTLQITAESPLAFAERKPGTQFRKSLPYVPGATIFGALGRLLQERGRLELAHLRGLRCYNAYPAYSCDAWVRPLPLTAIQPQGGDKQRRRDTLVERVCWDRQRPAALIYSAMSADGEPWKNAERGFYTIAAAHDDRGLYPVEEIRSIRNVEQRVLTRVAINRRRGTAEDQRLYSPLVLNEVTLDPATDQLEPTRFLGQVELPDDADEVRAVLESITHLGGRQSSGLGAVSIQACAAEAETPEQISTRVAALTRRFQSQATLYAELRGSDWAIADSSIFSVNLLSDAALLEQGWLPTTELSARFVSDLIGVEVELVRSFAAATVAGGWNVVWQQPKANAVVMSSGSLFVFQASRPLGPVAFQALAQLQRDGIGERRQEGYGQVRICDDFHLMGGAPSNLEERQ